MKLRALYERIGQMLAGGENANAEVVAVSNVYALDAKINGGRDRAERSKAVSVAAHAGNSPGELLTVEVGEYHYTAAADGHQDDRADQMPQKVSHGPVIALTFAAPMLVEDPLFDERTPVAAARQLAWVLAWATECELATVEGLRMKKSTAKSDLERHLSIARTMVKQCHELNVRPVGLEGRRCPRLEEALKTPGYLAPTGPSMVSA